MICEPYDIVVVPFPFSEIAGTKHRPALVLSQKSFNENGHSILAMITTKGHFPWPGDADLKDYKAAGLQAPCRVRLKLFTLDNRLLLKRVGRLSPEDEKRVAQNLHHFLA